MFGGLSWGECSGGKGGKNGIQLLGTMRDLGSAHLSGQTSRCYKEMGRGSREKQRGLKSRFRD